MSFKQFLDNGFLVNEGRRSKNIYDYSSLLVEPPEEISDNVISWGWDHVPNESIFFDPKEPTFGREHEPHITLIYGIHTEILKEVSDLFIGEKEFECKLGKIDMFTKNDKFDVLIVTVQCEELHRLNSKMRRNLDATESYPVYVPHVTICYLKKGKGKNYIGNDTFLDVKFKIDKVLFSSRTGDKTTIRLGSK